MKTKKNKEYSFNHFKERLKERYDLDINEEEYKKMMEEAGRIKRGI